MGACPAVTVVIPTRNRCAMLQEAVASVMQQSFVGWELVIVDDASEDSTWGWLGRLQDARVRKIHMEHPSERAAARNTGLTAARGEWLMFLDDDDRLPPRALETHVAVLREQPTAVASVGGYALFGDGLKPREVAIVRRRAHRRIWHDLLFVWPPVSGQCLFRTEAFRAAGGWDGAWIPIEDHALWLRVSRLGPVALLPEIVLMYRVHPGQWRPDNVEQMMTGVREESVQRASGRERERGLRTLAGRALAGEAHRRYQGGRALSALALYLRVFLSVPCVRDSPLIRPVFLISMLKCVIGGRGVHILRRLGRAGRRLLPWGGSGDRVAVPGAGAGERSVG